MNALHPTPMFRFANDGVPFFHVLLPEQFERALERLPERVYLSLDCNALAPSENARVGTPLPGRFRFDELLLLLELLFERKTVVGADLVEFSPAPGLHFPQMTAVQLAYDLIGLKALQAGWVQEIKLMPD